MKGKRLKKNLLFILAILVISALAIGVYYIFIEKTNPLAEIFQTIIKRNFYDNYNGIYTYAEELDSTYHIYDGCNVHKIYNYILIKDDKYTLYRGSCMGIYYKSDGKTKDLTISASEIKDTYVVKYDDLEFTKDNMTTYIVPSTNLGKKLGSINLGSLQLIMDETEIEGHYYNLKSIAIQNNKTFNFNLNMDSQYLNLIHKDGKYVVYDYTIKDLSKVPVFYSYGDSFGIIEKDDNPYDKNKYGYDLLFVSEGGIAYSLKNELPITVDNVTLTPETNSIFVRYNQTTRDYTALIGYNKKMCDENYDSKDKDEIMYYEFRIKYNYLAGNFEKPLFERIGYKSEGCKYIKNIMGG